MINTCNPLHIADIIFYCLEESKGVCTHCQNDYKNKGLALHLISDIAKMKLVDLRFVLTQAQNLYKNIENISDQLHNYEQDFKKAINYSFEIYLSTVLSVRDKAISNLNFQNFAKKSLNLTELNQMIGNVKKTIIDAEEYSASIMNSISKNQQFHALVKMQEISTKKCQDKMLETAKKVADIQNNAINFKPFQFSNPDLSYETILNNVGLYSNEIKNILINNPQEFPQDKQKNLDPTKNQNFIKPKTDENIEAYENYNNDLNPLKSPNSVDSGLKNPLDFRNLTNFQDNNGPNYPFKFLTLKPIEELTQYLRTENDKNDIPSSQTVMPSQSKENFLNLLTPNDNANFSNNIINPNPDKEKMLNSKEENQNFNDQSKQNYLVYFFDNKKLVILDIKNEKAYPMKNYASIDFPDTAFCAIFLDSKIFLNGGITNESCLFSSFVIDCNNYQLSRLANLNEKRSHHSNVVVGKNFVYCVGGKNDFVSLLVCEKFNFSHGNYEFSSSLKSGRI